MTSGSLNKTAENDDERSMSNPQSKQAIKKALIDAMKARDDQKRSILRLAMNAITAQEKHLKVAELPDSEVFSVLQKMIKQGEQSYQQYQDAKRTALAEKEQTEIKILASFLPQLGFEGLHDHAHVFQRLGLATKECVVNQSFQVFRA